MLQLVLYKWGGTDNENDDNEDEIFFFTIIYKLK